MSIRVRINRFTGLALALAALFAGPAKAEAQPGPIEVRVVIVTTWEAEIAGKDAGGELHAWLTRWPLSTPIAFPVGLHPLQYDPNTHVLAIMTGIATARASASIMALGSDPRFDLSHAYWIVAGTAGVDPAVASAGSAAWARWVVDGDLAQELDTRDMPADWPTGIVPYGRATPYEAPTPPIHTDFANVAYALNRGLVDWAYARSRDTTLPDDAVLARLRAPYAGPGARTPFVLEGEGLMSARTWYGERLNDWARRWVAYWTGGAGVFAMSAEEDTGILQALTLLAQDHRARPRPGPRLARGQRLHPRPARDDRRRLPRPRDREGFPADHEACEGLYAVAAPVARYLAENWSQTRDVTPGGAGQDDKAAAARP